MKAPRSSPLFLCLPLWAWTSGDKPKGQRLQREGLGTKLLLCGPSSKISPLIASLVTTATRKLLCRSEIKYCCHSPCHLQSSGGACHILAPGKALLHTSYATKVTIVIITLHTGALG